MSAPNSVPVSPASSKRSRSKDSTRSATYASLSTPTASTAFNTPAMSTNSLLPPLSLAASPNRDLPPDPTPYPAFLGPRKAALLDAKWNDLEWAQMNRLRESMAATDPENPSPWARCNGDAYAPRNRYMNVDPYQANRVHLDVPDGVLDYINASPITLHATKSQTPLKYIATQGPKADSWSHFWRMMWAENESPAVIVMVTKTHEQGREKCYPYYPPSMSEPDLRINEQDEFGDGFLHSLHLASLSHDHASRTEVREIDMTAEDGGESRKVWHLLFEGWPDFSVPEGADKAALLNMVDLSREKNSNNATNPRIVHCSAGIGRSGTFIALDWLIQELEEGSLDDPADDQDPVVTVVEMLRDQRPMMVQSKQQFVFIYDTLRERWRERWISQHPDEATRLGIAPAPSDDEPALKRQKSNSEGDAQGPFVHGLDGAAHSSPGSPRRFPTASRSKRSSGGSSDEDNSGSSDSDSDATLRPSNPLHTLNNSSEETLRWTDLERQPLLDRPIAHPPLGRLPRRPRHPSGPPSRNPGEFDGLYSAPCWTCICLVFAGWFILLVVPLWLTGGFEHTDR